MAFEQNPVFDIHILPKPLPLEKVLLEVGNPDTVAEIEERCKTIVSIQAEEAAALKFAGINPLHLHPEAAAQLRQNIQRNPRWQASALDILRLSVSDPENVTAEMLTVISRPWFNRINANYSGLQYDGSIMSISVQPVHSYLTHFTDALKPLSIGSIPLSVAGVPTLSGNIVLGYRGGHNYRGTLMSIPAGSVEVSKTLETAFNRELHEELGNIKPEDYWVAPKAVATVFDPRGKGWMYVVVDMPLGPASIAGFMGKWLCCPEREHQHLVLVPDEARLAMRFFEQEGIYDVGDEDPAQRSRTTYANFGKALPQCIALTLADIAAREREMDFNKQLKGTYFGNHHRFMELART